MSVVGRVHSKVVFGRRVAALARALDGVIPTGGELVDVGCGDGSVARALAERRPDLRPRGYEVMLRPDCRIAAEPFDGRTIPLPDGAADFAMLVDVLHHTEDPIVLLAEASRVARRAVILKDHEVRGVLARPTLRFMDWVGNAHHGVTLPYNYWRPEQWQEAFARQRLVVAERREGIPLYPFPVSLVFGRGLHFVARLERS